MSRTGVLFIAILVLGTNLFFAQETNDKKPTEKEKTAVDSLQTDLNRKGVVIQSGTIERKAINPLGPSKAAFYSAVVPGLGQIYNRKYWKVPIVWAAIGISASVFIQNNNNFNEFRDAFKRRLAGFTDDQFFDFPPLNPNITEPEFSNAALQDAQESAQRNRDLALLITIGLYALNIIDANVDAHLQQYNVDSKLAMDIKPFIHFNPINNRPNYGLAMAFKF